MHPLRALSKVPSAAAGTLIRPHKLSSYVVDKGERYLTAGVIGYVKGMYREKSYVKGMDPSFLLGLGATSLAVILEAFSNGRSSLAPHLNAVGDTGMTLWIASKAAGYATRKSGRSVYVKEAGAKPSALPPGMRETTVLGHQTSSGAWLSEEEILNFKNKRV